MRAKALIASGLVSLLLGCVHGGTSLHRLYHASDSSPDLPSKQVVLLEIPKELRLLSLDGKEDENFCTPSKNKHVFELLPGKHNIKIDFIPTGSDLHGRAIDLTWQAEPGHTYIIRHEMNVPWWSVWIDDMVKETYMLRFTGKVKAAWDGIETKAKKEGKSVDQVIQDLLLEWVEKE